MVGGTLQVEEELGVGVLLPEAVRQHQPQGGLANPAGAADQHAAGAGVGTQFVQFHRPPDEVPRLVGQLVEGCDMGRVLPHDPGWWLVRILPQAVETGTNPQHGSYSSQDQPANALLRGQPVRANQQAEEYQGKDCQTHPEDQFDEFFMFTHPLPLLENPSSDDDLE